MTDDLGVHRQQKHRALFQRDLKLCPPDPQDRIRMDEGSDASRRIDLQIGMVVEQPFDGQFHETRWLTVDAELVGPIVSHQTAIVNESEVADDRQRVRREIPRRRANTHRGPPHALFPVVERSGQQLTLLICCQILYALVDPAVYSNLVTAGRQIRDGVDR